MGSEIRRLRRGYDAYGCFQLFTAFYSAKNTRGSTREKIRNFMYVNFVKIDARHKATFYSVIKTETSDSKFLTPTFKLT